MRGKGITYDTGFSPGGSSSRVVFDPVVARRELHIIKEDLHCTAVRIIGGDPERLTAAGEHAAAAGLDVWLSPFPCELTPEQLLPYFADCAQRAEDLRRGAARVALVTGCELSLFAPGFIPGSDFTARMESLKAGQHRREEILAGIPARINPLLADIAATARRHFSGPLTYASIPIEHIDWTPFDIVGIDAYRSRRNAATYRQDLRACLVHGKPVAVTEFGCCAYRGAADMGAAGWLILSTGLGQHVRDEEEQVRYLQDLLEIFDQEGVDSAFWLTFAHYGLPHSNDPAADLDKASYGLVKILGPAEHATTYPGLSWEPKRAFHALAAAYA